MLLMELKLQFGGSGPAGHPKGGMLRAATTIKWVQTLTMCGCGSLADHDIPLELCESRAREAPTVHFTHPAENTAV